MVYCILHTAFPQNCLLILIQKLLSFSVVDVALTILEPLGPTSPLDHRSGVPERWLRIFSFVMNCYLRADVSNKVVTPLCVLDIASRGCKNYSYLIDSTRPSPFTYPRHLLRHSLFGFGTVSIGSMLSSVEFLNRLMRRMLFKQNCFCKDPQTLLSPRPCCLSITDSNGRSHQCTSWRSWSDFLNRSFCIGRVHRGSLNFPTFGLWPFYIALGRLWRISSFLENLLLQNE